MPIHESAPPSELVSPSSTDSSKSETMPQFLASVVEKGGNPTPYFFPASNGFAGGVGLTSSKSPKDSTRGHTAASILNMSPGVYDGSSKATHNLEKHGSGSAASVLGIPPGYENFLDLPHSVLQMVATALQCDVVVAGLLHNPMRLHETVLCVPRGMITVPVRLSKGLLAASTCEVVDTEGLLLPSMVTAALGSRPKRYLATVFSAEGYEGLCYALWLDPAKVPDVAECTMQDAGQSLPLLLANRVRSLCCDRMGRRFDSIMKRMPQAVVFVDDGRAPCLVNTSAAKLLGLPKAGEIGPIHVAEGMRRLADRSKCRANTYR
jgi:PAS domain-containing protein